MKKILFIAVTLIPLMGFAKVSDFNDMISDNLKAQSELHTNLKVQTGTASKAGTEPQVPGMVEAPEHSDMAYNAPTKKMRFKKEMQAHKVTQKAQFERLATELNDSEL